MARMYGLEPATRSVDDGTQSSLAVMMRLVEGGSTETTVVRGAASNVAVALD